MCQDVLVGRVVVSMAVPDGVRVTRVLVDQGVHLAELVAGLSRVLVKMDVYGDGVLMRKLLYPFLMVLRFTV